MRRPLLPFARAVPVAPLPAPSPLPPFPSLKPRRAAPRPTPSLSLVPPAPAPSSPSAFARGRGRGGHGAGPSTIAPELRQAMEAPHEPADISSREGASPEESPRPLVLEVTEQLKDLFMQGELSASQDIVQAIPVSSKSYRFPHRPGNGSIATRCLLKANHFLAELPDKDLHQYYVSITPEVTSRIVSHAVMEELVKLHKVSYLGGRLPVYDGRKSLETAGPLPFTSKEFHITLLEEDDGSSLERCQKTYKVEIRFAARADLQRLGHFLARSQAEAPQETLQVLAIDLRELPTARYKPFGRSFFSSDLGRRRSLGDGSESCRGFYQSIRPTQMGLSLNIDEKGCNGDLYQLIGQQSDARGSTSLLVGE